MNTILRLRRLRAVLSHHSTNPYVRGRAAQVAGGALVADGLVGLENPLDGRRSRGGVFGGVFFALIGAFFAWIMTMSLADISPYPDGRTVTAHVTSVASELTTDSKGRQSTVCRVSAQFTIGEGTTTIVARQATDSQCGMDGQDIPVSVRGDDPGTARVILESDRTFLVGARYAMFALIAFGLWMSLTRLAEIVIGVVLLVRGRRLVAANPAVPVDELMGDLQQAWAGPRAQNAMTAPDGAAGGTAAPAAMPGAGLLTVLNAVRGQGQPLPGSAPAPAAPPAGWLLDPAGSGRERWWDGTSWTEHYR